MTIITPISLVLCCVRTMLIHELSLAKTSPEINRALQLIRLHINCRFVHIKYLKKHHLSREIDKTLQKETSKLFKLSRELQLICLRCCLGLYLCPIQATPPLNEFIRQKCNFTTRNGNLTFDQFNIRRSSAITQAV